MKTPFPFLAMVLMAIHFTHKGSAQIISSLYGTHEIYVNAHVPDVVFTPDVFSSRETSAPSLTRYSRLDPDPGVVVGIHLSFDRLHLAERWCVTWQGPISVSVLVANPSAGVDDLTALVEESDCLKQFAAIQLIWCVASSNKFFHVPECCHFKKENETTPTLHRHPLRGHPKAAKHPALVLTGEGICGKYPINVMRNAAMEGAAQLFGADVYFFLVDIDLELHPTVAKNHSSFSEKFAKILHREEMRLSHGGGLTEGQWRSVLEKRLWVVPAVQTSAEPPETMKGFEGQITFGRVTSFYGSRCHHCYGTVDLPRFVATSIAYDDTDGGLKPNLTTFHPSSVPYRIPHIEGNEHFFVSTLKVLPPFIDLFFGRHLNKQQWHLELRALGLQFYSLLGALLVNRGFGDEPSGALRYTSIHLLYEQPTSLYEDCKFRLARIGRLAYYPALNTPVAPAAPWVTASVRQLKNSPLTPWSYGSKWAAAVRDSESPRSIGWDLDGAPPNSDEVTLSANIDASQKTNSGMHPPTHPAIGVEELMRPFTLRSVFGHRFPFQCVPNEADDTPDSAIDAHLQTVLLSASEGKAFVANILQTEVDHTLGKADPTHQFMEAALKVIFDPSLDRLKYPRFLYYQANVVLTRWWTRFYFHGATSGNNLTNAADPIFSRLSEIEERNRDDGPRNTVNSHSTTIVQNTGNVGFFNRCGDLKIARSRFDAMECKACVPNQGLPRAALNRLILQACASFSLGPLCDKAIDPVVAWVQARSKNRKWMLRVEGDRDQEELDHTESLSRPEKSRKLSSSVTYDELRLKATLVLSVFHYLEFPLADDPFALCSFNGNTTLLPCSSVSISLDP